MKQNKLKKNIILNILRNVMGIIYPLITFPYASRILLSKGIGKVEFATSIISIFLVIANLGIGAYASRELSSVRDKPQYRQTFSKEILVINLISTVFACVLLFVAVLLIPTLHEYIRLIIICSGRICFTAIGVEWMYIAYEDFDYITYRSIVFQFLSILLLFIFVKKEEDYIWYAAIGVFSTVGSNICNFVHARKYVNFFKIERLKLLKHIKPIFIFFGMNVAVYIYTMLDTTMLGFFTNDTTVGYYTAANKINRLVLTLITAIATVLTPRITYLLDNTKQREDFQKLVQRSFDFITCFSIPCVIGLIVLAPQIIILFCGKDFIPAITPMKLLSPVLVIWAFASILGSTILVPFRKEKVILVAQSLGAFVNFLLNIILIKILGIYGAIIATLIAETIVTAVQFYPVKGYVINKHFKKNLLQVFIASVCMFSIIFPLNKIINSIYWNIGLTILAGCFVYTGILTLLKNDFLSFFVHLLFRKKNQSTNIDNNH